jgi:PelA/Pel-15E family pectate lyase
METKSGKMGVVKFTFFVALMPCFGAVVGTSVPAQSITAARIARLPKARQAAWKQYLDRSARQMKADRVVLRTELNDAELKPVIPPNGSAARSMPLTKPPEWYAGAEALRIADGIVSFQTPAGGWSKNLNVADHLRRKGESFAPNNLSHYLGPDDFDTPADPSWNYVGTLDNDATTTELQFLAKVIAAGKDRAAYRTSFLRGVEYLFAAQFPNGGWPQVWPLEGGYHDAITFNDGAVTETLELLDAVADGKFPFVPAEMAKRAQTSVARGIDCILETQITENGKRTVWGQQHDALTLQPVAGRNYEPAAECSSESASMTLFLMDLPEPSAKVVAAVHAAVAWLEQTAIPGKTYVRGREGSRLEDSADGKRLWARYYEIGPRRPIFGDRDKSIHDTMAEISEERRRGYSWYNDVPQSALDRYAEWRLTH